MQNLLNKMSLREKVGQLNQRLYGWQIYEKTENGIELTDLFKEEVARFDGIGFIYGVFRSDPWSGKNLQNGLNAEEAFIVSKIIQKYLKEETTLGIPALLSEESPHGHQGLDSLSTPTNYSVGNSWNPELYKQLQKIVANDIRQKGAHLGLISTLDVSRDPRWGRTEECFSEDPYLTAIFSEAAVEGLQGTSSIVDFKQKISSSNVGAVLKHFAGQGSAMGGHNSAPVNIGLRELHEIHLLAMKRSIKKGAFLTMAAYNDIDGILCHGNDYLLNTILRDEMKFEGAVMADGVALGRLADISNSPVEAAAWALESGVDISLWDNIFPYLEEAVNQNLVSIEKLDQAVLRVLNIKQKLGLFENPSPIVQGVSLEEKEKLNVKMATESIVLLKNNQNILPLNKNKLNKVAIIGPNAHHLYNQLGDYTPFKDEKNTITVYEGIKSYLKEDSVEVVYEQGSMLTSSIENGIDKAKEAVKEADTIVLVLGGASARDFSTVFDENGAALSGSNEMTSGENIDLASLELPQAQVDLFNALVELNIPIVTVLIQGRPHVIQAIDNDSEAILLAGYIGDHGGSSIANILFGEDTPSGKLAQSIPLSTGQLPVYYNYRQTYFKKDYADLPGHAHYPFGYGLSYTTFSIEGLDIEQKQSNNKITLLIKGQLTNKGSHSGSEVIQVYIHAHHPRVVPRVKSLVAFEKIHLESKQSEDFQIKLDAADLSGYTADMKEESYEEFTLIIEAHNFKEEFKINLSK
ncbi:glycoside hydrolase family 3 N-terminal domain-containing protein [Fundicoccus sp. Sow4_H7]|uniref:glycoside hydrolase family 3 N-terminal domain-containing protein n=1 Tax=Fundicoccus sp. Sow4_H7 TaxID=3438784 RepID=UPI003F9216B4